MRLNLDKELKEELQGLKEITAQLQMVENQKAELLMQLYRKQGIVQFLQTKINQRNEAKEKEDK
ncbi:unnamed protein product [marine sediment metagenome]|uniref:Uncharacterized protein n=1 Tax=marine sediment metagenome TaxID=412755 RepID=X1FAG5_9ZZZZ